MSWDIDLDYCDAEWFALEMNQDHSIIFKVALKYCISGLLDSSVGRESTCNAGDPGSIPGSGRSPGEGVGCPLQCSWVSLVAQLVKNLPAMQETWVRFLGWKDPLEKEKATHSSILAWRIPWTWGCKESDTTEQTQLSDLHFRFHSHFGFLTYFAKSRDIVLNNYKINFSLKVFIRNLRLDF